LTEFATTATDLVIATLLVGGASFALIGSIGLARFRDFYKRIHGPTKATTLGVGCALLASSIFFTRLQGSFSSRELLIAVFLFITAPISAHLLVKTALAEDPASSPPPQPAAAQDPSSTTASAVPSTGTSTVKAPTAG
jgi:multicomponent K+:H+ antiporter subunit G